MSAFHELPTVADVAASRVGRPIAKPIPTAIRKEERKKTKAAQEAEFRQAVWLRDKNRCRATNAPVGHSGANWDKVGEVHHVLKRSTNPEERLNPSNGILLTKHQHALAEAMCPNDAAHYLLDIVGPADLAQPQTFIWRDIHGQELRRRIG